MFKKKFFIATLIFIVLILLFPMFMSISKAKDDEIFNFELRRSSLNALPSEFTGNEFASGLNDIFSFSRETQLLKDRDIYWYLTKLSKMDGSEIDYNKFKNSDFIKTVLKTPYLDKSSHYELLGGFQHFIDGIRDFLNLDRMFQSSFILDKNQYSKLVYPFNRCFEEVKSPYGWSMMTRNGIKVIDEQVFYFMWDPFENNDNYRNICIAHTSGGGINFVGGINNIAMKRAIYINASGNDPFDIKYYDGEKNTGTSGIGNLNNFSESSSPLSNSTKDKFKSWSKWSYIMYYGSRLDNYKYTADHWTDLNYFVNNYTRIRI